MGIVIPVSKVYALTDDRSRITRIDGGYTMSNITNPAEWALIDEGYGDRYNLCQSNYLPSPLYTPDGIPRWKLVNGKPVLRDDAEIEADREAIPAPKPTEEDTLLDLMADHEYRICMIEINQMGE